MNEIVYKAENITKTFPGVKALDKAHLNIYKGKVMALLGENGAGKSTLIKVLTGIYQADEGKLFLNNQELKFKNVKDSQKHGIAVIHQELNLIPELSIVENIFLGNEPVNKFRKIDTKLMYSQVEDILKKLGISQNPNLKVKELTIGQQQMVEIAKALSQNANIIIMDEPTDALTDIETENLFKVIQELKNDGKSILYISHRLKEIPIIAENVTIMRDGKFICEVDIAEATEEFIINNMVGRTLDEQFPRVVVNKGKETLRVENLNAKYVDNVSFNLYEGEILGICGLMGSGRTELMQTIFGYLKKQNGKIFIENKEVKIKNPKDSIKNGMVYVSEDRKKDGLILEQSVKNNMTISALDLLSKRLTINKKLENTEVKNYIEAFKIKTPSEKQIIKNLSGGNQQKVAIAKALMTNPKILILDEPTRGVDVGAKKEIYDFINSLKEKGLSIIIVSSEMPEILGLSDRIIVINQHKISGEFQIEDANQEILMKAAIGVI